MKTVEKTAKTSGNNAPVSLRELTPEEMNMVSGSGFALFGGKLAFASLKSQLSWLAKGKMYPRKKV
ncbi:hypothetical protein LMG33818_002550 [Halomonadaceae bacterium LMG 33818]|uniref:hypothetical protein n=1 Tax=Cernens ardua TaxID=3402176 RepID=UPI003EDBA2B4